MSESEKTQKDVLQEIADSHRSAQQDQPEQQEQSGSDGEIEQEDAVQQPAEAVVTPTGTAKRAKAERPPVEF